MSTEPYKSEWFDRFIFDVRKERTRQEVLWGGRHNSLLKWSCILMEECGELAQAILDKDQDQVYEELVQVAAVAVAWGEQILKGESDVPNP